MINDYTVDIENPKSWDEYFYKICREIASNSKCLSRKIGAIIVKDKTIISTGYNGPPRKIRRCDERWLVDKDLRKYFTEKNIGNKNIIGDFIEFDKIINDKYKNYSWEISSSYPLNKFHELRNNEFYKNNLQGKCPRYVMNFKSGQGLDWCVAGHAERNSIVNSARLGLSSLKGTKIFMTCSVPCHNCLTEIINAGIGEIIVTKLKNGFYDKSAKYLVKESNVKIRTYDFIKE